MNIEQELVKLANDLDRRGFCKEADEIDRVLRANIHSDYQNAMSLVSELAKATAELEGLTKANKKLPVGKLARIKGLILQIEDL